MTENPPSPGTAEETSGAGVEFEGELGPFMPLLRLGEYLHVGKATAFGQGWYRIR